MKYQIQVNNGNANLGVTQKTITANEVTDVVDQKFMAHYIHLHNGLIPEDVAAQVLSLFGECAAELMAQGHAIHLKREQDVLIRMYGDIHVKGGNINLERARELMQNPALTEAEMVELAGELVSRAGVTVRARCEAEQKLTDLLKRQDAPVQRVDGIKEVAFVPASGTGSDSDDNGGGSDDNGGGDDNNGSLEG